MGIQRKIKNFIKTPFSTIRRICLYVFNSRRYKEYHLSCIVRSPLLVTPSCVALHSNVCVGKHARIEGVFEYNGIRFSPVIEFGEGCTVEQGLHLTCAHRVSIGQNTAIAAYVTISDIHHPYEDVNVPIEKQNIKVKEVVIGDDCKIYNGAVITPGVHIGKHVTIGANAVVTSDIPDFCVAVGAPARIIKRYNSITNTWEKQ